MTNSISNDSAIEIDDWNDKQIQQYRNSWPKMIEKNSMIFYHDQSILKYKRPLPWMNRSVSSDKVFREIHFCNRNFL
jgi:hypothetical protein